MRPIITVERNDGKGGPVLFTTALIKMSNKVYSTQELDLDHLTIRNNEQK